VFTCDWIWVHAVSVGELILVEGLLGRLLDDGYRVHVTTGTVAGLSLLKERLPEWNKRGNHVTGGGFPLDDTYGLSSFFCYPPSAFISLETEIWPNLLRELDIHGIRSYIVNGRLTDQSISRGKIWMQRAASRISLVVARDEDSYQAFRYLGAPRVVLGGNLKADISEIRPLHIGWELLRKAWSCDPVIVVGNTVDTEEELVLMAWKQARLIYPKLRLVIAPRQPSRFQLVADLLTANSIAFHKGSGSWSVDLHYWSDIDILLLDTMGELASAYKEGTVALVGGGWAWLGGHNPMEPVRWGIPTLIGPGYKNFDDLVKPLLKAQLVQVVASDMLASAIIDYLAVAPLRSAVNIADCAVDLPESLTGALDKTWKFLKETLPMPMQY
jgi:3-deoxy-D-manno-octulosonic-acid transferase